MILGHRLRQNPAPGIYIDAKHTGSSDVGQSKGADNIVRLKVKRQRSLQQAHTPMSNKGTINGTLPSDQMGWLFRPARTSAPAPVTTLTKAPTKAPSKNAMKKPTPIPLPIPIPTPIIPPVTVPSKIPTVFSITETVLHTQSLPPPAQTEIVPERQQISALYQQAYYTPPSKQATEVDSLFSNEIAQSSAEYNTLTVQVTSQSNGNHTEVIESNQGSESSAYEPNQDLEENGSPTNTEDQFETEANNIEESAVTLNRFRISYYPTNENFTKNREVVIATAGAMASFLSTKFNSTFDIFASGYTDFVPDVPTRKLEGEVLLRTNRLLTEVGTSSISYKGTATGLYLVPDPELLATLIDQELINDQVGFLTLLSQATANCQGDNECQTHLTSVDYAKLEKYDESQLRGEGYGAIGLNTGDSESNSLIPTIAGIVAGMLCIVLLAIFFVRRSHDPKDSPEGESVVSNSHNTSAAVGADASVTSESTAERSLSDRIRFPMGRSGRNISEPTGHSSGKTSMTASLQKSFTTKPPREKKSKRNVTENDAELAKDLAPEEMTRSDAIARSHSLRNFRRKKARPKAGQLFAIRNKALGDADAESDALTTIQEGDCETSTVSPDDDVQVMQGITARKRFSRDDMIEEGGESDSHESECEARCDDVASWGSGSFLDWFKGGSSKKDKIESSVDSILPLSMQGSGKYQILEIKAPPGKLGLTVFAPDKKEAVAEPFSNWCVVESIQETGPLIGLAKPGDYLARIDKHDLSGWTPMQISDYIRGKVREERKLILCRPTSKITGLSDDDSRTRSESFAISAQATSSSSNTNRLSLPTQHRLFSDDDTQDSEATGQWLQLDLNHVIGSMQHSDTPDGKYVNSMVAKRPLP